MIRSVAQSLQAFRRDLGKSQGEVVSNRTPHLCLGGEVGILVICHPTSFSHIEVDVIEVAVWIHQYGIMHAIQFKLLDPRMHLAAYG